MRWTDEQIKAAEAVLCERIGEPADGYYAEMIERMLIAVDVAAPPRLVVL